MANSEDEKLKTDRPGTTKEEMEAAKKVVANLLLARKNFSLYPEGHIVITNAIDLLHKQLEAYLKKFGDLRFDIERYQLLSQGEVIYSGPPEEGTLPFTLYRDGIRWLEFADGVDSGELDGLLKIINKYTSLSDEPEGDIVTAFWETQLPHIRYEVADFFWGAEQEVDFIPFPEMENEAQALLREAKLADWKPLTDPPIDQTSLVLSPIEQGTLQEMIAVEEKGDPTAYVDALLDSLLQDRKQENFEIILEVLEDEFKGSLARKDFDVSLKILQSLQYVLNTCAPEIPWVVPLIEDFVLTASSDQSLKALHDVWPDMDYGHADTIKQILLLLQPEAIPALSTILLQNQPAKLRQILVEVITSLASRDLTPLESLVEHPDERLMERLVHVFVNLDGEQTSKVLMKLIRHTSSSVRREALKGILQRGNSHMKDVFPLIDDKDEIIRRLILKYMGQSRDQTAEDLLLRYLERQNLKSADSGHIIACFITLGQCGSSRSIPFLRRTLFGRRWFPTLGSSANQEGAAISLSKLRTKEAQKVLEDASRCLSPGVRRIARKVRQEHNA